MASRDLKIYTENIEPEAVHQIYELIAQPAFDGSRVRIMPDVHCGTGCVVGFTAQLTDKIIPNVLGVDLGCGMLAVELGKADIDLPALDAFIKEHIPTGSNYRKEVDPAAEKIVKSLHCKKQLREEERLFGSLGTLGGGNHFLEIDTDGEGNKYLIVHSGSRNLGLQVAKIYQKLAVERCKTCAEEERNAVIEQLKGSPDKIPGALAAVHAKYAFRTKIPAPLCYLDGADMADYLDDLRLCQKFAVLNRKKMADEIVKFLGIFRTTSFETVHNYIGDDNIIRKGAIRAGKGEKVLIPMNMRDGCFVAVGKGNEDWNNSAPHGAGRLLRRSEVKEYVSVEEFRETMAGVYSTTVGEGTLDESPFAYKPMEEIRALIEPTVEVVNVIKPLYNFKAGGD